MSALFEELDYQPTPIGPISLRRRRILSLDTDVFEIILGDEHLMSSLFTASEVALAHLGLAACKGEGLDVVIGGLGLGYTAQAALEDPRIASLLVVELLQPIIDWHEANLLPLDPPLSADPRCRIEQADFFAAAASKPGFDPGMPARRFDAILIDIDHTPDWHLAPGAHDFYASEGLAAFKHHLKRGGVMGLWSDAEPDPRFVDRLSGVFAHARAEPVTFPNPLQAQKPITQTIYLAEA